MAKKTINVKSAELGKSESVMNLNVNYNNLIDELANAILALKVNPDETGFLELTKLWDTEDKFSILSSITNRKKIEKAFRNMYDQFTYENSVMAELIKAGNVPEEVEIFTI